MGRRQIFQKDAAAFFGRKGGYVVQGLPDGCGKGPMLFIKSGMPIAGQAVQPVYNLIGNAQELFCLVGTARPGWDGGSEQTIDIQQQIQRMVIVGQKNPKGVIGDSKVIQHLLVACLLAGLPGLEDLVREFFEIELPQFRFSGCPCLSWRRTTVAWPLCGLRRPWRHPVDG
jgi:hypothetical protein